MPPETESEWRRVKRTNPNQRDEWKYPAVLAVWQVLVDEFGTLPRNALTAYWFLLRLRQAENPAAVESVGAELTKRKRELCEVGLAVLRSEFAAARERVTKTAETAA